MSCVQNSRDKARRGESPRLARHAEKDGCSVCEIIGSKFCVLDFYLPFLRGSGWEGPNNAKAVGRRRQTAVPSFWRLIARGTTLAIPLRWLSVRGWRFHSPAPRAWKSIGGISLEFGYCM